MFYSLSISSAIYIVMPIKFVFNDAIIDGIESYSTDSLPVPSLITLYKLDYVLYTITLL